MGATHSLTPWEPIIEFEVRRHGPIIGFDSADLKQEMRLVVDRCLPKLDGSNTGRMYVRTSMRHALQNLKRAATTAARLPQDARGKGLPLWYLDTPKSGSDDEEINTHLETLHTPDLSPEEQAANRELLAHLDTHLSTDDRAVLILFMEDAIKTKADEMRLGMVLARASKILHRVASGKEEEETMPKIPKTPKDELPTCHVDGEEPIGYETNLVDAEPCQDCPDKFSCLKGAIAGGLIEAELSIDPEVAAVFAGTMTYDVAADRVSKRQELREKNQAIPAALMFNTPTEETTTMTETTTEKPTKKRAPKAKAAPKAKSEAKAKAAPKAKREDGRPKGFDKGDVKLLDDGRLQKWDGRFLPAPKEIAKEKVLSQLANKIKIGLPFDLAIGMKLKMERRDGSVAVIAITSSGYKVEKGISGDGKLHPDGAVFSSLSAACMWTSPTYRTVSCNDVLNFEKHNNIEVSGKGVPGKKFRKGSDA